MEPTTVTVVSDIVRERLSEVPPLAHPLGIEVESVLEASNVTTDMAQALIIQGSQCLVYKRDVLRADNAGYWNLSGKMSDFESAVPMLFSQAWPKIGNLKNWQYHLIKSKPMPDGKLSLITDHFSPEVLQLIQASPDNPVMRAHIMRRLKEGVPDTIKGYEELKNWIESKFEKTCVRPDARKAPPGAFEAAPVADPRQLQPRPPENALPCFAFSARASEHRSGSCRYSCVAQAQTELSFNTNEIMELFNEDDHQTARQLLIELRDSEHATDEIRESDWDEQDFDYSDYEENNASDFEMHIRNYDDTEEAFRQFLITHLPELAIQLGTHL